MEERNGDLVGEEEARAAQEAGRIGGSAPHEGDDPSRWPVEEAGGGEAEGFELAEEELVEHAEHGDDAGEGIPRLERLGSDEAEPDTATYGEPDQEDVTEVTSDPAEGPDDPGAGPGIAADR